MKNYGVNFPAQNKEIQEKTKQTNMSIYNVPYAMQSKEVQQKAIQTNLIKYNAPYPKQNPEIAERDLKNSYKRKLVITPAGKTIYLQGYEPQAYEHLLKEYHEDDIITDNTLKPEIWWNDLQDQKHRYYCDFYIPSEKLIFEIKSTYTYNADDKQEKIEKTKQACKEAGFKFKLWIMSEKGEIIEEIYIE